MEPRIYQFLINTNLSKEFLPEFYIPVTPGCIPADNFVISRDSNGRPVSHYSDMMWDFTSYDIKNRNIRLYFNKWSPDCNSELAKLISNEIKQVFFIVCWVTDNGYKAVASLTKLHEALINLAKFAYIKLISIFDVLKSELMLHIFLKNCAGGVQIVFNRILSLLIQTGIEKVGFSCCSPDAIKGFSKTIKKYRASLKQHPPIPSRIYLNLINILKEKISEYEESVEGIVYLARKNLDDSYDGGTLYNASLAARKDGFAFKFNPDANHKRDKKIILARDIETIEKIVKKFSLNKFFNKRSLEYTPISINKIFMEIYSICKLVIHVFTGMRHDEVAHLPYNCLDSFTYQGVKSFCIKGGTTKFGEKNVVWITNHDAHRAVKIVQKLALVIYEKIGINLPDKTIDVYKYPLFIRPVYAGLGMAQYKVSHNSIYTPIKKFECQNFFDISITEQDLCELEKIDPFRVWRDESNFKLNSKWNFTTHQLRRSLALYASSSGIVSLPSLKRQLKHITDNMSLYYSKGSSFAENLLSLKKDHFARDYQESVPVSQSLTYLSEVIFSNERLFGPLGTNLEKKRRSFLITTDREKTLSMFKSGEMSYQETFLGGCTTVTPCESKALRSLVSCLNCSKAIIKKSKLEIAVRAQEKMIEQLSPTSVEFRSENEDLLALKSALYNIEKKEK